MGARQQRSSTVYQEHWERRKVPTTVTHVLHEPYDIYIGRPSIFGSPFWITRKRSRIKALRLYAKFLFNEPDGRNILRRVGELRGLRLGCYCAPLACHGHILAALSDKVITEDDLMAWATDETWAEFYRLVFGENSLDTVASGW